MYSSVWPLLKKSALTLMQRMPIGKEAKLQKAINVVCVMNVLLLLIFVQVEALPGVKTVHSVHFWSVKGGKIVATLHVIVDSEADQQVQEPIQ